jgi:hypothetical protein
MTDRPKNPESRPQGDRQRDERDQRVGEPTLSAASGLGPRDRDRERERERERERPVERDRDLEVESHRAPRPSRPIGAIVAALLLGLLLGGLGATLLANQDDGDDGGDAFAGLVDARRYQAVILSNDKVYFGQLSSVNDQFYELDKAFFLRETRESADAEPVRALLPVNREIHAPDNTMLIRKDEVVLIENLADDSPILTEIERQLGDGK